MVISRENRDFIDTLLEYYASEADSYRQIAENFVPEVESVEDTAFGIITGCVYSGFLQAYQNQQQTPGLDDMQEFNKIIKEHAPLIKKGILGSGQDAQAGGGDDGGEKKDGEDGIGGDSDGSEEKKEKEKEKDINSDCGGGDGDDSDTQHGHDGEDGSHWTNKDKDNAGGGDDDGDEEKDMCRTGRHHPQEDDADAHGGGDDDDNGNKRNDGTTL